MIEKSYDILTLFPVRKSKRQKEEFRRAAAIWFDRLGYQCNTETGRMGAHNLVIGDPEKAKYLITAHYDTCAWLPFPNLATPCSFWLTMLYQLAIAAGMLLIGSAIPAVCLYLGMLDGWYYLIFNLSLFTILLLVLIGPANRHNANDNTSGVVAVMETARSLPEALRGNVCFVLFDLEEAGLIGSASYHKAHKEFSGSQVVFNMDCVGDGDEILFLPSGKLRKDREKMDWLKTAAGKYGPKSITLHEKGFSSYASDQANFPLGIGICALRRSKWAGLYIGKIHTQRDRTLDQTNVNILRACLISLISQTPAK